MTKIQNTTYLPSHYCSQMRHQPLRRVISQYAHTMVRLQAKLSITQLMHYEAI